MNPLSPTPCVAGGSRTTEERIPWSANASVRWALATRPPAPLIGTWRSPAGVLEREVDDPVGRGGGVAESAEVVERSRQHPGSLGLESLGRGSGAGQPEAQPQGWPDPAGRPGVQR